ncbi:myotubularin-related protein 13 [Platysternon megacephalum]|uniref:Myotubularin-related protein 13 n=1 Tax=Platysternon megacephalum TaxID=55544 RepID=A0A4D9DUZ0_9SAUR|nr:myotubularin-related protein 13 [Platysternon megacephalum]
MSDNTELLAKHYFQKTARACGKNKAKQRQAPNRPAIRDRKKNKTETPRGDVSFVLMTKVHGKHRTGYTHPRETTFLPTVTERCRQGSSALIPKLKSPTLCIPLPPRRVTSPNSQRHRPFVCLDSFLDTNDEEVKMKPWRGL